MKAQTPISPLVHGVFVDKADCGVAIPVGDEMAYSQQVPGDKCLGELLLDAGKLTQLRFAHSTTDGFQPANTASMRQRTVLRRSTTKHFFWGGNVQGNPQAALPHYEVALIHSHCRPAP